MFKVAMPTDDEFKAIMTQVKLARDATDDTLVQLCSKGKSSEHINCGDLLPRHAAEFCVKSQSDRNPNMIFWYDYIEEENNEPTN